MSENVPSSWLDSPTWRPVARARAHELVIEAIEDQILSGALKVGDPLPAERELAARLQVSRAGVREAIRVLEGQGVLRSSVGAGAEAGTFIASFSGEALTRFLRLHIALSNFQLADVIDARVMLERSSAIFAAENLNDESVAGIRDPLNRMNSEAISREEFNDADTAFHVAIAEASGNRLVADLTIAIRASLRAPILEAFRQLNDWSPVVTMLREQHQAIFDAIIAGDGKLAADLTEHHIRAASGALPALHSPGE
ncbi:transcriptional regulator, GntR family [Arthrobacter subterraneus]|uniref:Transcriptional regulator, GntR family n=1 Tax=Arthrobacter subterraneus TaxID=335973 RepID=A0A1G8N1S1_9MICC|nr:FadR/GntR family transcriptional regulator [Arthrobacter subterraneus]SDI74199.1 transcriptional regulator, GntR family [Arthrobacter subterraneus]